jgi:hypothetical protein
VAPPKKTVQQYETEAYKTGSCLIAATCVPARKLYQLRHGAVPIGLCVLHTCDVPRCINDKHHFLGTKKDNTQDAVRKGRHSGFRKGGVRFSGKHTLSAKNRIGAATKKRWANKAYREKLRKAHQKVNNVCS